MNSINVLNEGYSSAFNEVDFHCTNADGSKIFDEDNNAYIDLSMGGGCCLLGHQPPFITTAITQQLMRGSIYTIPNKLTYQCAENLHAMMPWYSDFVFCSTGSEATLRALRIARAYNKKSKVAMFSGSWHGSHDFLLYEEDYDNESNEPSLKRKSSGMLDSLDEHVVLLPYNDPYAFEILDKFKTELSLVIIEPVQGSNPQSKIDEFLNQLREFCTHNKILLCFDEVITGARLALGGAQEYFNIKADLATYGKSIGGGLPLGIVAGTPEVMSTIKSTHSPVFMGGTFSANPLSMAACLATTSYLINNKNCYLELEQSSNYLRSSINEFCINHSIKARLIGIGSFNRLIFTDVSIRSRKERDLLELEWSEQADFFSHLRRLGVYIGSNRIIYLSTAHSVNDIDKVILAFETALSLYHSKGFI